MGKEKEFDFHIYKNFKKATLPPFFHKYINHIQDEERKRSYPQMKVQEKSRQAVA